MGASDARGSILWDSKLGKWRMGIWTVEGRLPRAKRGGWGSIHSRRIIPSHKRKRGARGPIHCGLRHFFSCQSFPNAFAMAAFSRFFRPETVCLNPPGTESPVRATVPFFLQLSLAWSLPFRMASASSAARDSALHLVAAECSCLRVLRTSWALPVRVSTSQCCTSARVEP